MAKKKAPERAVVHCADGWVAQGKMEELCLEQPLGMSRFDCVVMDPPYNLGIAYDAYKDNRALADFRLTLTNWLSVARHVTRPGGAIWAFMSDEHAGYLAMLGESLNLERRNWVKWHYTFGVHQKGKFNRSSCHLFYFVKPGGPVTFNRDAVAVESARQRLGDKRAAGGGPTPHDVWMLRPEHEGVGYLADGDVWHVPRVAGSHKERGGEPTQLPERLIERILLASTNAGDWVFDPFVGSGTTPAVARKLGRKCAGTDVSGRAVEATRKRIASVPAQPGATCANRVHDLPNRRDR